MKRLIRLAAVVAVLAIASSAVAQPDAHFAATTLTVTGHGEASAPPDMATIELGVVTQGSSAADAMHTNAAAMAKVIAAVKAGGVPAKNIQTASLTLSPQYGYGQSTAPRLSGYQASNQVTVTIDDLAGLGPIVDAVVNAGATSVSQIRFSLKSPAATANIARIAAVRELEDKAAVYADAAGYHVQRLVSLSETTAARAPLPMVAADVRMAGAAPTPVETGQITVAVDVSGEFELTR